MRIRVIQIPPDFVCEEYDLRRFIPGQQYEVGNSLGALMLAEGWAEPVASDEPAVLIPLSEFEPDSLVAPPNLVREIYPPYYDGPFALAADRRRRRRSRPA